MFEKGGRRKCGRENSIDIIQVPGLTGFDDRIFQYYKLL